MLVPAATSRSFSRILFLIFALTAVFFLPPSSRAQVAAKPAPTTPQGGVPPKANPETDVGKAVGSRPS